MPKGVKSKPWEADGVSKSTWFRHKRKGKKPAAPSAKARARADVIADMVASRIHQVAPDPFAAEATHTVGGWTAVTPEMKAAMKAADAALVDEFLTITAVQFCGPDHIYHRISPAMVDALRRRVSGG